MLDCRTIYEPFTGAQREELTAWSVGHCSGLGVRFSTDHVYLPEVAILFVWGSGYPSRYFISPTQTAVMLVRPSGGHWQFATLKAALEKVMELEGDRPVERLVRSLAPVSAHSA